MSDYISREAATKAVIDYAQWLWDRFHETCNVPGVTDAIRAVSSADVVEVVRCKDCKHYEIWQLKSDYTDDKRYKPSVCTIGRYAVHRKPDWYCADAERRANGCD